MKTESPVWLLLVLSLPTEGATARMRIWRALKALGCGSLRDGAYLLPFNPDHQTAFKDLATECIREGGRAWVMSVAAATGDENDAYRTLFDRSEEYRAQIQAWRDTVPGLSKMAPNEMGRLQRKLQRDLEALRAIDFFPRDIGTEAEANWRDFNQQLTKLVSPDEPSEADGAIPRLSFKDYQGRVWATRQRLWVDRVASAWLIRRFIDRDAQFHWLAQPSDCPKTALGFDFDGATFTHVGERVTFETLMASFGLESDAALLRLANMVHALDVGGEPGPEARGFEAILTGARERLSSDDALLNEMGTVLDSLHAHFQRESARKDS